MKEKSECEQINDKLKEKNAKLEGILEEVLGKQKLLGIIEAGPEVHEGKNYYRVRVGGSSTLLTFSDSILFPNKIEDLEIGREVVCLGGVIASVLPAKLFEVKEETEFDLIGWEEIGGLKSQLGKIREAVELPLNNEKLFKEFGLEPMKGILLAGPPGCGKTLIAKAIASTSLRSNKGDKDSFIYVKGAELLNMYVGATEASIRAIFKSAREYSRKNGKRAVIFFDEAEALMGKRGTSRSSDVDKTIVPMFLSEMDGLEGHNPLIILSTNLADVLDPAITRPGRIDLKVEITRPNVEDSMEIFAIHLGKVKCFDPVIRLAQEGTEAVFKCSQKDKVSGAMIEQIVKTAAHKALTRRLGDSKAKLGIVSTDILNSIES